MRFLAWVGLGLFTIGSERALAQASDRCALEMAAIAEAVIDDVEAIEAVHDEVIRRARWSGLLPSLRVGIRRGLGQGLSGAYVDDTQTQARQTFDASLAFDVSLSFSLERLLFAPEEIALVRATESRTRHRDESVAAALELYTRWLALDAERDRTARLILSTRLDAMTRGTFSRRVRSASQCRAPEPLHDASAAAAERD